MTLSELGQTLRDLRGERTQEEIAALSGVPQNTISSYEAGKIDVPTSRLHALLTVLCRSAADRRLVGDLLGAPSGALARCRAALPR